MSLAPNPLFMAERRGCYGPMGLRKPRHPAPGTRTVPDRFELSDSLGYPASPAATQGCAGNQFRPPVPPYASPGSAVCLSRLRAPPFFSLSGFPVPGSDFRRFFSPAIPARRDYRLLATGYWLPATGYRLPIAGIMAA